MAGRIVGVHISSFAVTTVQRNDGSFPERLAGLNLTENNFNTSAICTAMENCSEKAVSIYTIKLEKSVMVDQCKPR